MKYGSKDLVIEFDNSSGTLVDITQHVTAINGVNIEALLEEGTTYGDSWVEQLFTGVKQLADITVDGFYDDTATTGPHALFNDLGATRTFKVTWGGSKTTSVETIIRNYNRNPVRKELTKYQVTLAPTGAVTEA
jgi:hypothetical protein